MIRRRIVISLLGCALFGAAPGAGVLLVVRPWAGGYMAAGEGLALGPARQHRHSAIDFAARAAKDALEAAAGAAVPRPTGPAADAHEASQEQDLLDAAGNPPRPAAPRPQPA